MKFHEHTTWYQAEKRQRKELGYVMPDVVEWTNWALKESSSDEVYRLCSECQWYTEMRPYYKVWPAVAGALTKINLGISLDELGLDDIAILLRFPLATGPVSEKHRLMTVLFSFSHAYAETKGSLILVVQAEDIESGRIDALYGCWKDGSTEKMQKWFDRYDASGSALYLALKMGITTILLKNDPTFVVPDVLAKHRQAYKLNPEEKYVKAAAKKGVVGWNIGESYESIPHIRRPHLGLRWTGKGGAVPRIVPIKGSIVHRDKMTQVPTGYITPEGVEVEV